MTREGNSGVFVSKSLETPGSVAEDGAGMSETAGSAAAPISFASAGRTLRTAAWRHVLDSGFGSSGRRLLTTLRTSEPDQETESPSDGAHRLETVGGSSSISTATPCTRCTI